MRDQERRTQKFVSSGAGAVVNYLRIHGGFSALPTHADDGSVPANKKSAAG